MKQGLLMFSLVMMAVFLGNAIGDAAVNADGIEWLAKSYEIGISTFDIDLQLCVLTFGLHFKICIAEVLLLLVALLFYPKLSKMIFG